MAYRPIDTTQPDYLDTVELIPRSDGGKHKNQHYPLPPGLPPAHDARIEDPKGALRSNEAPSNCLPVHSWRAAALTPLRILLLVFDAILASAPIVFIALALAAARLNDKDLSQYGSRVLEILRLSPTISPLIFAALMGRFFRHLGVYLAERGTSLGRLEQLVGCQSVFSALERQFSLRSWSVVGLLSIIVWLLSPVGGQSAVRLLRRDSNNITSTVTVRYMNPSTISDSLIDQAESASSSGSTYTSIFLAALLSSSKYQDTPMGLWETVKFPIYRYIENATDSDWKPVRSTPSNNVTYASLISVPVVGPPSDGLSTFKIRARQFDITCSSNELMGRNQSGFSNMTVIWKLTPLYLAKPCADITECSPPICDGYPCPFLSKSLAKYTADDADDAESENLFSVASCELSFEYFEADVQCHGTSCAAQRMRKLDLLEDGYTGYLDNATRQNVLNLEMEYLPIVDSVRVADENARGSTNMEKWMYNPADFIGLRYDNVQLYQLSPELFAERLTILFNTFFQSTYRTQALSGNLPESLTQTGMLISTTAANVTFNGTDAVLRQKKPVYKTDWRWFTALLMSSSVLLAAAYVGLILKYITLAPDIGGYASSLTLQNPYIPTPTGGKTLYGMERTALLHDLPVRIGDVCADEPVGVIALAKLGDGRVARLDRKRLYI